MKEIVLPLPKTNSSPLKIGHPKRKFNVMCQPLIFRGKLAVSFRNVSGRVVPLNIFAGCFFPQKVRSWKTQSGLDLFMLEYFTPYQ